MFNVDGPTLLRAADDRLTRQGDNVLLQRQCFVSPVN
jgi:hypothetical protein